MARRTAEPRWLTRVTVDAIQADQIREHGGLPGIRAENALESALARPQQKWHYGDQPDMASRAAACGCGLVRNHPYRDGNKRIGFLAIVTFLEVNGWNFDATDTDIVAEILALADGHVTEDELAGWIRERATSTSSSPRRRSSSSSRPSSSSRSPLASATRRRRG